MNANLKKLMAVLGILMLAGGLAACEDDKGPAEKAGESIDESMEEAGDSLEEMGDEIQESANDAAD
ncbi:hypothetical protein [Vreelandella jeotgali]|uniref:hypothetical protein n=1 Tax=Vreelandella jeotgali TaxID=553386 RepID=UPI000346F414|nr:hypothetical protein [Halomonas jeotgali]